MALTKVSYSMINGSPFNILDFGADPTGQTDSTTAIQNAINAASAATPIGSSSSGSTGFARTTLFFPAGVYVISSTLAFQPFVNYVGVRSTTVDSSPNAPTSSYPDSRGTILRATTAIYNASTNPRGTLGYVATGDITFRDLQFVGTGQLTGNGSTGIQWGSSGGVAVTGISYETDGDGQNVSGVEMSRCTFYSFITGFFNCALNDAYFYQTRFESNTTSINWSLNTVVPISQTAQFFGCVFFAHVNGMAFGVGPSYEVNVFGGAFIGTTANVQHVSVVNSGSAAVLSLIFDGVNFSFNSNTNTHHFYIAGYYVGATNTLQVSNCRFNGGDIVISKASGAALFTRWQFNNCTYIQTSIVLNLTQFGQIKGGIFLLSGITITNSTNILIRDCVLQGFAGNAISVASADCGNNQFINNTFTGNAGDIAIFDNSTNDTIFMENNIGISVIPTRGKTIDYVNNIAFASLGTPANGSIIYCPDGTIANPVAGAGTGCMAKRLNGVWVGN
jgi:hypothetical protein